MIWFNRMLAFAFLTWVLAVMPSMPIANELRCGPEGEHTVCSITTHRMLGSQSESYGLDELGPMTVRMVRTGGRTNRWRPVAVLARPGDRRPVNFRGGEPVAQRWQAWLYGEGEDTFELLHPTAMRWAAKYAWIFFALFWLAILDDLAMAFGWPGVMAKLGGGAGRG